MSGFFRFAITAVVLSGFGGIAQAQSRHVPQDRFEALYVLPHGVVRDTAGFSGTTVMGLRVPR